MGNSEHSRTLVDPAEWFAKVESLEAEVRAMTKSRDNWLRKYTEGREDRRQLEGVVEALRERVMGLGGMRRTEQGAFWIDRDDVLRLLDELEGQ
jgi:hypothetical protein